MRIILQIDLLWGRWISETQPIFNTSRYTVL